jgi:hypothetical protein
MDLSSYSLVNNNPGLPDYPGGVQVMRYRESQHSCTFIIPVRKLTDWI